MSKKKISLIQRQYRFNKGKNLYSIDVSLNDYDDVYDVWDPAPFKKRFIHEEFDDFIVASAEDIPLKYDVNIVLYLPEVKKNSNKETSVESAFRNYYSYEIEKVRRNLTRLRKKNVLYFLASFALLSLGTVLQRSAESVMFKVIKEGIYIGGWVFLWEFITNVFNIRKELRTRFKQYQRLYVSELKFIYK